VLRTEQYLLHRFAVDDLRLVRAALLRLPVDEIAGVAGLLLEVRQADESLPRVVGHRVERAELAVVGEHLLLVEAPAAETDADFGH
jgi:hypothetical protein